MQSPALLPLRILGPMLFGLGRDVGVRFAATLRRRARGRYVQDTVLAKYNYTAACHCWNTTEQVCPECVVMRQRYMRPGKRVICPFLLTGVPLLGVQTSAHSRGLALATLPMS